MPALSEQQAAFGAALLAGANGDFLSAFIEPAGRAGKRFAAYRRNVFGNWRAALAASYPVLATLVGAARFECLAENYRMQYPSRDGDLNRYGERFPDLLAADAIADELPYLPDLARLEWALEEVYGATEPRRPDFARLSAVPLARQGELRLQLSAAIRGVESLWPLAEIWSAHQATEIEARDAALAHIALRAQRNTVVVARDAAQMPLPRRLSPGEAAFFAACGDGENLAAALLQALAAEPTLDVAGLLPNWLERGWIADLQLPAEYAP